MKLQKLLSFVRKACDDYSMIENGDRIAVGLSGGKDSLALLVALSEMRRFYPNEYKLEAVTVSLGFDGFDPSPAAELCARLGVNHSVVKTDIGQIVFDERKEKNPCSLCSKMRKGALNNKVLELGCNKIALGHNRDDIMESFFMSLFYEGRINTFAPVTYLDRTDLYSIRPLMYVPEKEIISFKRANNITTVKNPCTVDGYTKREEMKKFIAEQNKNFDHFEEKIFGAIKRSGLKGW